MADVDLRQSRRGSRRGPRQSTGAQGSAYEDIACVTAPDHRRRQLALSCVTALCEDIASRGRAASWTCSRDNRPSRLPAWTAGFRLEREYVHCRTGNPAARSLPQGRIPA